MSGVKRIAGVDPGLASGGIVCVELQPERIVDAESLRTKPGKPDTEYVDRQFTDAIRRAEEWMNGAAAALDRMRPDLVVIESFVDLPSRARRNGGGKSAFDKNRWMTPLVIGRLDAHLRGLDVEVRYQNPSVLKQFAIPVGQMQEANSLSRRGRTVDVVFPGDHLLVNEHLLSAWSHAAYAAERV